MADQAVLLWRLFDGSGQKSEKTAVGIVPLAAWGHSCVAQVDCSKTDKRGFYIVLYKLPRFKNKQFKM